MKRLLDWLDWLDWSAVSTPREEEEEEEGEEAALSGKGYIIITTRLAEKKKHSGRPRSIFLSWIAEVTSFVSSSLKFIAVFFPFQFL